MLFNLIILFLYNNPFKSYFRTLRIIKSEEELYVWYSRDFAQILDIPDKKRSQNEGNASTILPQLI